MLLKSHFSSFLAWMGEMLLFSLPCSSSGTRSYCDDWKQKTTSERRCAICLLSAASTPFHFHTNLTAIAISNWRCHPLTFDAGVNAVSAKPAVLRCLKSQESSASVPCYAERQTDPFCMFIILHLVNLVWKFLSRRLCSSMLSEAGLSVNAMWPFFPLTSLPTHPLSYSSPSEGHLTLPSPFPSSFPPSNVLIKPAAMQSSVVMLDFVLGYVI